MAKYIAIVRDGNISGELMVPVDSIDEAADIIRNAGRWENYPDAFHPTYKSGGAVLLDAPTVYLVRIPNDGTTARIMAHRIEEEYAYGFTYDAMLETGPRGGVTRVL